MSKLVSFIVLTAFVLVFAAIFFWVMASFVLPLFLAAMLAVIFRPLHGWIVKKCRGRDRVAAGLTTVAILVIVLAPLIAVIFRGATEAVNLVRGTGSMAWDSEGLQTLVGRANQRFGLDLDAAQIEREGKQLIEAWLLPVASRTPAFLVSFLIGLIVMIVALYYFLADGSDMTATIMRLLPLDRRYQQELVSEFETVSRAVVSATLLSAVAQGLLAGIGYKLAGLQSIFLLMMLTMFASMVPFVGAASIWASCSLWLFLAADRPTAAILLAVYGAAIVSSIDNVIKPIVLHGQSKLHPLLALLSVLGGVQALGPIGIFVGPMAVAFLQAGLNMLHHELVAFEPVESPANVAG